ncbi:MAG: hypothetical protein IPQ07_10590 [Myxococcales bacterium]|nr:hypothetical protein [Myxococcales bacterium]
MRRGQLAVLVVAVCLGAAVAHARRDDPTATLSAAEVQAAFASYVPDVRTCYLTNARGKDVDGNLRLELIIHPSGKIFRFGFAAPGVRPPWLGKLDTCLRALADTWQLPARKGYTTAVLPFLFQRTTAPGAGPIESCWDARGCPPGKLGGKK